MTRRRLARRDGQCVRSEWRKSRGASAGATGVPAHGGEPGRGLPRFPKIKPAIAEHLQRAEPKDVIGLRAERPSDRAGASSSRARARLGRR